MENTKIARWKMVEGKGLLGISRCSWDDNIKMKQIYRIFGTGVNSYSWGYRPELSSRSCSYKPLGAIKCCKNPSE